MFVVVVMLSNPDPFPRPCPVQLNELQALHSLVLAKLGESLAFRGRPTWISPFMVRVLRRAARVSTAAIIATTIAVWGDLPFPWFTTLAAITTVEITFYTSVRSARNAIVGAIAGAVIGVGIASFGDDQIWAVGIVVAIAYLGFGMFNMDGVARQSALLSTLIVMVPLGNEYTLLQFAAIRLGEMLIGIAVALAVNAVIFPPRAYQGVRRHLGDAIGNIGVMYRHVVAASATGQRDDEAIAQARTAYRKSLRLVDDLWDEALGERSSRGGLSPHWRSTTRRLWEYCAAMDVAVMDAQARQLLSEAEVDFTTLAQVSASAFDALSNALKNNQPIADFSELATEREELLGRVHGLYVLSIERAERLRDTQEMPIVSALIEFSSEPATGEVSEVPFTDALQVFMFANAMLSIAHRLGELIEDEVTLVATRPK